MGYVATRFNFRGVGLSEGAFDDGVGETADALAALAHARERFGELPVALAGFSFGSFVQTRVAASVRAERLVMVGAAAKRLAGTTVPPDTIVVHGEEDDVVPLADVLAWARPQQLPLQPINFEPRAGVAVRVTDFWSLEIKPEQVEPQLIELSVS